MSAPLPLAGLRILAFTQLGAGPYGMQVLGDLGAEVVKVEDPTSGGDEARAVPPARDGDSLYFQSFNRNTRALTLDLRTTGGRALLRRLAAVADAVYANPRGDLPAKLGLDYASLRDVNPRLVCATLTGFGRSGPRAADPAYDYLIQGLAGFMQVTGEPEHPPVRSGVAVIDFAGGLASALGLMIALLRARESGVGGDVDVSLHDVAISMLTHLATMYLHSGREPERLPGGSHPSVVPSQTFATQDGWMLVMCMKEKFWRRLCALIERPDLADHAHYADFEGRLAHRAALIAELESVFRRRPTAAWITVLQGQVPCAPVNSVGEALADPQVAHRAMVVTVDHPVFGALREVGCPIKIDDVQPVYRPAPLVGADTDSVLQSWLGLSAAEIAALRREGAV
ncbi:MAG: CoA transferase [Deltaproteobacteria bacterium]|nr:CoA transferase [Deltaproteobacteria bacterium]